jgi:tRNA A-37 threonylcarbamoyl transferase component Bud32
MFPTTLSHLQELQTLEGSSKPKKVLDPNTNKVYVLKTGFNQEHITNEYQVNMAYRAMGCKVPQSLMYNENGVQILIEFINGVGLKHYHENHDKNEVEQVKKKLRRFFVLDAWFAK